MTLDRTLAQSRVISARSWYLTSFLILSFVNLPYTFFTSPKHKSNFSLKRIQLVYVCFLYRRIFCFSAILTGLIPFVTFLLVLLKFKIGQGTFASCCAASYCFLNVPTRQSGKHVLTPTFYVFAMLRFTLILRYCMYLIYNLFATLR